MSSDDSLIDIYALKRYELPGLFGGTHIVEGTHGTYGNINSDNVIFLNQSQVDAHKLLVDKNGDLVCDRCKKISMYIYDSSIGHVCPLCLHLRIRDRKCASCGKPLGCASCAGKQLYMMEIETTDKHYNLLLCVQNRCLMPFGYHVPAKLICSCELDIIELLSYKTLDDITRIISDMITDPPDAWKYWNKRQVTWEICQRQIKIDVYLVIYLSGLYLWTVPMLISWLIQMVFVIVQMNHLLTLGVVILFWVILLLGLLSNTRTVDE